MKILLIGDDLGLTGGVVNYTKPLFYKMRSRRIDVEYLTTSTFKGEYSYFTKSRIKNLGEGEYKLTNSEVHYRNLKTLDREIFDKRSHNLILNFIKTKGYDIVHIHSSLGVPASIYRELPNMGVKLFVTVHEYYWLCPKRVMIDYEGNNCAGPYDMKKCSMCVASSMRSESDRAIKTRATLKSVAPYLLPLLVILKAKVHSVLSKKKSIDTSATELVESSDLVTKRFNAMISALNAANRILCVSQDVVNHLERYGVNPSLLHKQHIGSLIAEKQVIRGKKIRPDIIKIGYIGGITFYKGVHLLVNAFLGLKEDVIDNVELHLYGSYHEDYMDEMREAIKSHPLHARKIHIHGRYDFDKLGDILDTLSINVLPSLCADTAPQTIFESYSRRIPVVGPDIGGFKDFIEDGKSGLIFKAGDADDLRMKLLSLVKNPEQISKFSARIPDLKTLEKNIDELVNIYIS